MAFRLQRRCKAKVLTTGEECRQAPLRERDYCYWHDPENEEAAAEARRHGGLRRKRESTLAGAYDFDGITSDGALARLLDIAAYDALTLDVGLGKVRALVAIVQTGEKVLLAQDFEERLNAIESVLGERIKKGARR